MGKPRAFLSFTDHIGLDVFARSLDKCSYECLAYGSTQTVIEEAGVPLGSMRETLALTLNLTRQELSFAIAKHISRGSVANSIGLVGVGIKPLDQDATVRDVDLGGLAIITATLDAGLPILTHTSQLEEASQRIDAGEFFDRAYLAGLAGVALAQVTDYPHSVERRFKMAYCGIGAED